MGMAVAEGVEVKELPGCRLEATIQVPVEMVQEAREKAVREVGKGVSLPGFRKGRVPESLVLQQFGAAVDKEWRKQVSLRAWELLVKTQSVKPLRNGVSGRIESCSLEAGARVHYQIDCEPQVPTVNLEGWERPALEPIEVSEQEMENYMRQIARWAGTSEEAELVADGTAVSFELYWADKEPAQQFADEKERPLDQLPPWLVTALMGKRAGEQLEMPWGDTPVEDEELVPQGRACRIVVKQVRKLLDHAIDDTLAQKVGAGNLEQMRDRVRQRIAGEKRRQQHKERRLQLREQLLKKVQFDVPESVVAATLNNVRKDEKEIDESVVRGEITDGVRLAYLGEAILRQHGQSVTYQDVLAKVQEMSPPWADHQKLMKDLLQDEQANARLTSTVMVEKALDCLLERLDSSQQAS